MGELFSGRAVAALARDPEKHRFNGQTLASAHLAKEYGIVDERGLCHPALDTSVKNIWGAQIISFLTRVGFKMYPLPKGGPVPWAAHIFWNVSPDLDYPSWFV